MISFSYQDSPYPIREDLQLAYRDYWQELARPGNWWSGEQRVAIAQETRNAVDCAFCAQRKQALSPYNLSGNHQHSGGLDDLAVDAVHRIITDQGRITQAWIDSNSENGLSEESYVELLGIVVAMFSIDEFNRALGLPLEPLPEPVAGVPDNYRPAQAERGTGFVSMLPETDGAIGAESDLWQNGRSANVLRALSLVPNAVRAWNNLSKSQYLGIQQVMSVKGDTGRSLNRMQMEIIAGRVSSINECFY
jgi:hypothetical protein